MPITFTNNWKNILDKLESILRTEFKGAIPVYRGKEVSAGNQFLRLDPLGSDLIEYNASSETREYSIEMTYHFRDPNIRKPALDHIFRQVSRVEALNTGKTRLSGNVTGDASKGIVREVVSPQNSNALHIVDTRGNYTGIYDLIKVVIDTAGVIGTAKFDVYGKSTDSLKADKIVDAETINGQYQSIGNGLQIRFAGKNSSSAATAGETPDEWEIEVWGRMESMDDNIGNVRSVKMTRGGLRTRHRIY